MADSGSETCSDFPPVVVMGVTGCGKTEVGSALAERLGAVFIEGDRLHPPENIARMSAGIPLTDEFRAGWLDRIGEEIAAERARGRSVVAGCSALKRKYRDRLRRLNPDLVFLHLVINRETSLERVSARKGHFMPATLVDSQFADLEPPAEDEVALGVDGTRPIEETVSAAVGFLDSRAVVARAK